MERPYRKGEEVFDLLFPHIKDAIRRAASLEQRQRYDEANPIPNPSTQAHHLAEFLYRMQNGETYRSNGGADG